MKKSKPKKRSYPKKGVKTVKKPVKSYETINAWHRGGINE